MQIRQLPGYPALRLLLLYVGLVANQGQCAGADKLTLIEVYASSVKEEVADPGTR